MNKVIILQGIPASGKTTWAKQHVENKKDWVIVSRDAIRESRGTYWIPEQEKYISELETNAILSAIKFNLNIIIDATNFNKETLNVFNEIFEKTEYDIEIKRFDVTLEEALRRDKDRSRPVGEKVIKMFYKKYISNDTQRFILTQNETLEHCIIVDIDGTLALNHNRNAFDYKKVDQDLPNNPVIDLINTLSKTYKIIILSGREDIGDCKKLTENWLNRYLFRYDEFYMRNNNDFRKDEIIKNEIYVNNIKNKYCVAAIFDDRNQVVNMWRKEGLLCNQVYYGDF